MAKCSREEKRINHLLWKGERCPWPWPNALMVPTKLCCLYLPSCFSKHSLQCDLIASWILQCVDAYTVKASTKSKYDRKAKGKEYRGKCSKFWERWYYYFCFDILVWICQRHLSEIIALSVMSLTHHGRQSRRDYIFGHSIIRIWELLTWILAPNREECFQTLPQSIPWMFHKKRMKYKWNQTIIWYLCKKKKKEKKEKMQKKKKTLKC